ncbi:hypothetical protein R9C00_14310 [Flammeovirgaceae bacterium SG7u.111]|nr:hypothetical protein [Flammeovirgaceae bacterium SG7u.132]WPO38630.1 hypothetical protein R9C00_14310 [Flammeovirgaceae bacterium SG7u.111]
MDKEVEDIIRLGKDSIVQLALNLIDERIDVQNFSKIKVMTDGKKVYVSFMNPIKYLPINSAFYFDIGVDLSEKTVVYGPVSNGVEHEEKIPFYIHTNETKLNIQFVMEAINKSDEVGSIDVDNFEDDMIIRESENYYSIHTVSESQESSYKIEKISGKIYDSEHAHLEALPFEDEDRLKEIKRSPPKGRGIVITPVRG